MRKTWPWPRLRLFSLWTLKRSKAMGSSKEVEAWRKVTGDKRGAGSFFLPFQGQPKEIFGAACKSLQLGPSPTPTTTTITLRPGSLPHTSALGVPTPNRLSLPQSQGVREGREGDKGHQVLQNAPVGPDPAPRSTCLHGWTFVLVNATACNPTVMALLGSRHRTSSREGQAFHLLTPLSASLSSSRVR